MGKINWKDKSILLDEARTRKIEELKIKCSEAIYNGFTSVSTGYEFGFNERDQDNFYQQLLLIVAGTDTSDIQVKTKNNGVVLLTIDQFKQVVFESQEHKVFNQNKFWDLEQMVLLSEDIEDIKRIEY